MLFEPGFILQDQGILFCLRFLHLATYFVIMSLYNSINISRQQRLLTQLYLSSYCMTLIQDIIESMWCLFTNNDVALYLWPIYQIYHQMKLIIFRTIISYVHCSSILFLKYFFFFFLILQQLRITKLNVLTQLGDHQFCNKVSQVHRTPEFDQRNALKLA